MSRVLEELWYGNITPIDRKHEKDSEFAEAVKMMGRNANTHESLIDNAAKEVFEKYREAQSDVARISECETFISGLRLGARIIIEAFIGDGCFDEV